MAETDELIYKRYMKDHDEADLLILLERHRESLVLFLYSIVHNMDDAEELMLDTYAEIAAGGSFSGKSSFKTWLFSIGKHKALMSLRKKTIWYKTEEDIEDELTPPPELEILNEERNHQLFKALGCLNKEYRQVLILLYFEEMSMEEAARVMGKNRKQIYNLSDRGRKALKGELERMGFAYAQFE